MNQDNWRVYQEWDEIKEETVYMIFGPKTTIVTNREDMRELSYTLASALEHGCEELP